MNDKFEIGKEVALKYIMFKKRTKKEVIAKLEFLNYSPKNVDKIIEYLEEAGYIDDNKYIEKYLAEIKALKNWSVKQVKNDLFKRGYEGDINEEDLAEYEMNSIKNLYGKYKMRYMNATEEETQNFISALVHKGFSISNINKVIKEY